MNAVDDTPLPEDISAWIGRSERTEDEIGLTNARRMAAMLDLDPADFRTGSPLPPLWYSLFFTPNARQSQIGHDGHPRKGDFLPPIGLPRRMFVGRSVSFLRPLRIGEAASKTSTIAAITPKHGRSGALVFLTVRHTIETMAGPAVVEDQQVVYREAAGSAGAARMQEAGTAAPAADWTEQRAIDPVLLFRYSALTWNGHRIHYDADYARAEEGYPGCVMNGALTVLLLAEAGRRRAARPLAGLTARLSSPLFSGEVMTLAGHTAADGRMACQATGPTGIPAAAVTLSFAP
ncbi:MaoC family dehydratase N-terminal domain-containing protein [Xanthobacter dioxanivorans]|uniref:MaoC family dehydratase N-terminal domain-containing protein n=2 Tax=Xanthobacter dioxanivorans TaxID=2528964 RepID=A0A974SKS5_9HYPH|nr:MaoC family dehydratase N-terminal domain-containing protein [Xanthobacter dioxanivorans]